MFLDLRLNSVEYFPKGWIEITISCHLCLKHHSYTEVVSVNHSKDCLKSSNAEAKRRAKYIRVCFKESKIRFEVNTKNVAKFRINLAVLNLYFWSSLCWKAICLKNNNSLDSLWEQEFYLQSQSKLEWLN